MDRRKFIKNSFFASTSAFLLPYSELFNIRLQKSTLDNSSLLPPVLPDAEVALEGYSPDWVKSLIITEFRIETATDGGTFASAVPVLDHYAETGVNGLWIGPVYERPDSERYNGYGNFGPHTLSSNLTGVDNIEDGYHEIRRFVEAAHRRNIRVIFDIVAWGVHLDAPLFRQYPEFFERRNGEFREAWGGYLFDWDNPVFREWYFDKAVNFIEKTGADGFRVDLAPERSRYHFREIRERLLRRGRKIILVAELPSERQDTFDFDQMGVNGWTESPIWGDKQVFADQKKRFGSLHDSSFIFRENMVDAIRTGTGIGCPKLQQKGQGGMFRYYAVSPLIHDGPLPFVNGNRVRLGYLLLSPFIPIWWIGEEWNNPHDLGDLTGVMYNNRIDWSAKEYPENLSFFEDIKRMIRVRRMYPEIFGYFPTVHRDANIEKVKTLRDGHQLNPLQAYMRYDKTRAVLVVPNHEPRSSNSNFHVEIPWSAWGMERAGVFRITDLMQNRTILRERGQEMEAFDVHLPADHLGLYLLEKE